MFFNALVLTKKGPLGKIWLAAHYRKKLSKKDIIKVNVSESVDAILESRILISLRTSSHLLYGISYLLNKQVSYLLSDALEYAYCVPQFVTNQKIDMEEQLERSLHDIDLNIESGGLSFNLTQENVAAPELRLNNLKNVRLQGEAAEILCDEFSEVDILRAEPGETIHGGEIIFDDKEFLDDGFGGRLDQDPTTIFDLHSQKLNNSTFEIPSSNVQNQDAPIIDFFDVPPQPNNLEVPMDRMDHIPPPDDVDHLIASPRAGPSNLAPSMEEARQPSVDETSRNAVVDEELVIEPLDESIRRPKRQKLGGLIIDENTEIATNIIKSNIRSAQEPEIELAPTTRKLMATKKKLKAPSLLKTPEKCFSLLHKKLFQNHLKVMANDVDQDDESTVVDENINQDRSNDMDNLFNNQDVQMDDLPPPPPPGPDEHPVSAPVIEEEHINEHDNLKPDEPVIHSSQEKAGSQRRRKRQRLSQEQARRGTLFEPEILHRDSHIEFEKTQVDPLEEIPMDDFFFSSQTPSELQSTQEDFLLSQLSQTLSEPVAFKQLTQDHNRKKAALTFFQLLSLHKQCVIILNQEKFYDEIYISKGPNFRGAVAAF